MISSLNSGPGVIVTGGTNGPYVDLNRPSAGMLRYNGSNLEAYDGNSWLSVGHHASVQLDSDTRTLLEWARKKMYEEQKLHERMKDHPGLKDAYEKFRLIDILTLEEDKNDRGEVQASP